MPSSRKKERAPRKRRLPASKKSRRKLNPRFSIYSHQALLRSPICNSTRNFIGALNSHRNQQPPGNGSTATRGYTSPALKIQNPVSPPSGRDCKTRCAVVRVRSDYCVFFITIRHPVNAQFQKKANAPNGSSSSPHPRKSRRKLNRRFSIYSHL